MVLLARTPGAPTVYLCVLNRRVDLLDSVAVPNPHTTNKLIYAQPYTPVLAEERRDRCVDHDRCSAGDAGARAPGELHLLLAAITERRIDRSMRAALAAWRTPQAEDTSVTIFAHLFTDRERAGMRVPRVQALLALSVYPFFCFLLWHASMLVR